MLNKKTEGKEKYYITSKRSHPEQLQFSKITAELKEIRNRNLTVA